MNFVLIDDQEIILTGEHRSVHEDYSTIFETSEIDVFIKKVNLGGSNTYLNTDAGLSEIRIENPPEYTNATCSGFFECEVNIDINYKDIFVTITNYGDELLETVQVSARYDYCPDCDLLGNCTPTQIFTNTYDLLSLSPGESKEVYFGDIFVKNQSTMDHELCLWTSTPNNQIDKNSENDLACELFNLSAAHESQTNDINLSYLPFQKQLVLSQNSADNWSSGNIEVYDLLGRQVFLKKINWSSPIIEVDFDFPSNLYFAVYRSKDQLTNLKFINY